MKNVNKDSSIVLVDDHNLILDTLKTIFTDTLGYKKTFTYNNPQLFLDSFSPNKYQIIILDISMEEMSGIDLAKKILNIDNNAKIIFLTMHDDEHHINEAFDLNIHGYIVKNAGIVELEKALINVLTNKMYCSPIIEAKILEMARQKSKRKKIEEKEQNLINKLTSREIEILDLIIQSKTTNEIAGLLCLSTHTVSTHRKNIGKKLKSSNILDWVRVFKK